MDVFYINRRNVTHCFTNSFIKMKKVLKNACYGGFSFSDAFCAEFNRRFPDKPKLDVYDDKRRADPDVIALFEEFGTKQSSGKRTAKLVIHTIPDGAEFTVSEYDGFETIKWSLPNDEIVRDLIDVVRGTCHALRRHLHSVERPLQRSSTVASNQKTDFFASVRPKNHMRLENMPTIAKCRPPSMTSRQTTSTSSAIMSVRAL